jgi:peroxiredoxin
MIRVLILGLISASMISLAAAEEVSVAASAKELKPLKAGDALPEVSVNDAAGKSVTLRSYHTDGPAVIVFFRGSWCPICTKHFHDLIKAHPEMAKSGAQVVAISPDTVENTRGNTEKLKIPFPLLSDSDLAATKAFGLAFQVDEATITKYKGFGIDLEKASGRNHHALPVPAVYIVNKAGKITFAHSNPDYTKRLDVETILRELKKAQ